MEAEPLNSFQRECEELLRQAIGRIGMRVEERSVGHVKGIVGATDSPEPFVEARVSGTALTVFIYQDGAEISGPGIDERMEDVDYASLEDLARAFVDKVIAYASSRGA